MIQIATVWKPSQKYGGADNLRLVNINAIIANTICARYYKGISCHGCNAVLAGGNEMENVRIRKLTPKECWRLQGWGFQREDGSWDDTAFDKAKAAGVSDSQLYKQAGNGCSANITYAIGLALNMSCPQNAEKE